MRYKIRDYSCASCERDYPSVFVDDDDGRPRCDACSEPLSWVPSPPNTDEWGGPRYITSLDKTFRSKGDLRAYMRENRLMEVGDRVGGARNDSHLNLGKHTSFQGKKRF